jgi:hypothetical protein
VVQQGFSRDLCMAVFVTALAECAANCVLSLFGSVRCLLIQLLRNRPRDTVCWAAGAPLCDKELPLH